MGDVYLARHGMLSGFEKHCVLKMLRDDRANDPELLARFADEARVVVQLSHRNVCPVFDVGRVGDRLYVVLEHIVGHDLRTVAMLRPLPTAIALHIVGEVCEALDYAHRFVDRKSGAPLGLVHRDVSPHNVLLGVDGDTKLIDFGIATTRVTAMPSQEVLGKLTYMSPEHARGEVVYATAVMLTELLLAERFHEELGTAQVRDLVGEGTFRPARHRPRPRRHHRPRPRAAGGGPLAINGGLRRRPVGLGHATRRHRHPPRRAPAPARRLRRPRRRAPRAAAPPRRHRRAGPRPRRRGPRRRRG